MTGVLIIGASGILGQYLLQEAKERGYSVEGTCSSEPVKGLKSLDLTDPDAIRSLIRSTKPETVLLPAAMTSVDGCETQPDLARKINSDGPLYVAKESASVGAEMVYFSTDYIFDGSSCPSAEDKQPRPLSIYGKTKLEGERNVLASHPSPRIIRTCANFGWNRLRPKENSVTWIINRLRRGQEVGLFTDQWVSPSYTPDVAKITYELLESEGAGIFHMASKDCLTRFDMGMAVCETFDLPQGLLRPTKLEDANLLAPRPHKSCLATDKVERILDIHMSTFRECLTRMRDTE